MVAGLKAGHHDPALIKSAQSDLSAIAWQAGAAGLPVKDLPVPIFQTVQRPQIARRDSGGAFFP